MSCLLATVRPVSINIPEPPRPNHDEVSMEFGEHVRVLAGPSAQPRPEQLLAVQSVITDKRRTLLVARTGFGKSAVYFSITRMLRDRGWGPTIVISPLLALMRDQAEAARRLGLAAVTINSSNIEDWAHIEEAIDRDEIDLLLIAPERLANAGFRHRVFDTLGYRWFALVCDEAHCISDWGHDFRPDYRRLRQLLQDLPPSTPVLATTATANQRVTDDVAGQLGSDTRVLRTSLDRSSLYLSVVDLPTDAHRLAWLAEALPKLNGSGIIYCLTVQQAEVAAQWLDSQGYAVRAYTGAVDPQTRLKLESALADNELKALVATSALGMGYDKGDLAFCVHLGLPPSPVAYYQQIGRAGRNLERAEVIALPRPQEDQAIWRWFESVSLPTEAICQTVLDQMNASRPTSMASLEQVVNVGRSRLGTLLNILEVDGALSRTRGGWIRREVSGSEVAWSYNHHLATTLKQLRRQESQQMRDWANLATCRLQFLREALDDEEATECGRCDRCSQRSWQWEPEPNLLASAQTLLNGGQVVIKARRQWPTGLQEPKGRIRPEHQVSAGRALSRVGDGGWNLRIEALLAESIDQLSVAIPDDLLWALGKVLKRWDWEERPAWICPVPSRRHSGLIEAVATGLGQLGNLPVYRVLVDSQDTPWAPQRDQANSAHQVTNVWGRFQIDPKKFPPEELHQKSVLLIDDEVASGWTMTTAGWLLRQAGFGTILPLALRTR